MVWHLKLTTLTLTSIPAYCHDVLAYDCHCVTGVTSNLGMLPPQEQTRPRQQLLQRQPSQLQQQWQQLEQRSTPAKPWQQ
jgi:hypothetical protein